jgi:hypothetical protein
VSFLKRLASMFSGPVRGGARDMVTLSVQCNRCGEIIATPVDLRNDLSADYDESTGAATYVCRKLLVGRQRCFQQIEVVLHFDGARKLVEQHVTGGKLLEPELH